MKPAIRERIDALSNFKANGDQVTSFYLTTDKSRMAKKEILANVNSLIIEGEAKVAAMNLSKDRKEALLGDLAGISSERPEHAIFDNIPGTGHLLREPPRLP